MWPPPLVIIKNILARHADRNVSRVKIPFSFQRNPELARRNVKSNISKRQLTIE